MVAKYTGSLFPYDMNDGRWLSSSGVPGISSRTGPGQKSQAKKSEAKGMAACMAPVGTGQVPRDDGVEECRETDRNKRQQRTLVSALPAAHLLLLLFT